MENLMQSAEMKKILKYSAWAILFLAIFLGLEILSAFKDLRSTSQVYNSISVTGEGEAVSVPDIATFSFSVSADAKVVSDAQATVTKNTDAIFAELKALGVEDKDIKTTDYSVWPKYAYTAAACSQSFCPPSRQIPDGYTVSQTVSVKVRKTEDAGKTLAVVGDKGATNVSGLNFTTDDPNKNINDARGKAIEDAQKKAKDLAKRLGVDLVRVTGYSDNNFTPGSMYYASAMGLGGADMKVQSVPSVPAGENKTKVSVVVTYEIR